ncbi:unnamed protein product [Callosobruchus maculatus]|uniref:Uncharacterized protein n=1 Tax=Callosobruchus maculatus TaxID=64391 RepID=A0A653CLC2_CALMS|nr:unnamed protein product [Callosobruchus maculatus]
MPSSGSGSKQGSFDNSSLKNGKKKSKTEYATLKLMEQLQQLVIHIFFKSYGPINYKAASIYAAMKRNQNNNRLEEVEKDDLL